MIELIVFSVIFLVLLCMLLWTAHGRLTASQTGDVSARLPVDFLVPRKPEEFKLVREALARIQQEIEQRHISPAERRCLLKERNKLARELLTAIHEDFVRLDCLLCAVAAVSPEVSRQKEFERFWLSLRFGARYRMALLSTSLGALPSRSIPYLQILTRGKAENLRTLLKAVDSTLSANLGKAHVN
jgi:hypothetical protein